MTADDTNLICPCYVHPIQIDTETCLIHAGPLFDTLNNPTDTNHKRFRILQDTIQSIFSWFHERMDNK